MAYIFIFILFYSIAVVPYIGMYNKALNYTKLSCVDSKARVSLIVAHFRPEICYWFRYVDKSR